MVSVEDERLAELGKPRMGDVTRVTIMIKESQEFKVSPKSSRSARLSVSVSSEWFLSTGGLVVKVTALYTGCSWFVPPAGSHQRT